MPLADEVRDLADRILGRPDENRRGELCEMKAARDVLEHNRGVAGNDYIDKAGNFARCTVGEMIQIDEPYLLRCIASLRQSVESMVRARIRRSSGPSSP